MKIAVFGSSGLLGVKIIGRLLESEIEVVGIQRSHENQNISATIISGDIKEIIDWSFLEGVDQVIYLVSAGSPGNKILTISDYINDDFNVLMTVYKKALDFNVARFIYFSSAGALYRNSSKESDAVVPTSPYGVNKLLCESFLLSQKGKMKALILRISNVYGTGLSNDSYGVIPNWIALARRGKPLVSWVPMSTQKDFIYIDDLLNILANLVGKPDVAGLLNVSVGESSSLEDIYSIIYKKYQPTLELNHKYVSVSNDGINNSKLLGVLKDYKFLSLQDGINLIMNEEDLHT